MIGKILGRKALQEIATILTPDTILRWHRQLVARKWDYGDRRKRHPGRPPVSEEITQLVLRMARENPDWGYDRIQGALANPGYTISDQTVGNILKAHGIEPAPERKRQTTWKTYIKAHWDGLVAIDFTTIEVWTRDGLVTFYLLFVMVLNTRRVYFAGCTTSPSEAWMKQTAREPTNCADGFLIHKKYLIMDRDTKFCNSFRSVLQQSRVEPVILPPRSPNLNPHLERFFGSIKSERLNRMIFFDERSLRNACTEYLSHYHVDRNHQELSNRLIRPGGGTGNEAGPVECRELLGGMLRYYYREAA